MHGILKHTMQHAHKIQRDHHKGISTFFAEEAEYFFHQHAATANRFHDLVMGSASRIPMRASFGAGEADTVAPLEMVTLSGTIYGSPSSERSAPCMSPLLMQATQIPMECWHLVALLLQKHDSGSKQSRESFPSLFPKATRTSFPLHLDAGTGANKDDYISASGSGGFGQKTKSYFCAKRYGQNHHNAHGTTK